MAALGNHDFDVDGHAGQDSSSVNMEPFHTYFPYPHASGGGVGDSYTYNVNGQAWFLSLDTYPMWGCYCCGCDNLQPGSAQYQWLDQALTAIDNDPRQWKIVLMHASLYSPGDCNLHASNSALESLLEQHGVDLVLTGHEHYYARKTVPTTAPGSPNTNIVHLLLGGAGAALSDWNDATGYDCALKINHFSNIKIDGDVLHGSVVSAYDTGSFRRGDVVDSFTINRKPQARFTYSEGNKGSNGYPVFFKDRSSGHRYQYQWDFGDGSTSTERNPTKYYAQAGTYNVTLTINSLWSQSSKTNLVQPLAVYEYGPRVGLMKAVKPWFSNLTPTTNYQLQLSADMNTWTNHGSAFTATNTSMIYPQYWDVDNWSSLFFRVQVAQ
jgi:hypothetical protein